MKFSQQLTNTINDNHLLNHPFYQKWMKGQIKSNTLVTYAQQYAHHVEMFPRYLSQMHALCDEPSARSVLAENLCEEEGLFHGKDHPTLWQQFTKGLQKHFALESKENPNRCNSIDDVVRLFQAKANSSTSEALATLYTYESMVPEVASSKIKGLIDNYDIKDRETLEFFTVHQQADVAHREALAKLIDRIPAEEQQSAVISAKQASKVLWEFLSEMDRYDQNEVA